MNAQEIVNNIILFLFGIMVGYGFYAMKASGLLREAWLGFKGGKMMRPHQPCEHRYYSDNCIKVVKCDLCGEKHAYDKEDEFHILGYKNIYPYMR